MTLQPYARKSIPKRIAHYLFSKQIPRYVIILLKSATAPLCNFKTFLSKQL